MEYYPAIKNKEILPFAITWMKPKGIMLSEISQTEKDQYCLVSLICKSQKRKKKKKSNSQIQRVDWWFAGVGG